MRNVSRKIIHELAIPFPPKSEQIKIVQKVDTLVAYCEQLENQLTKEPPPKNSPKPPSSPSPAPSSRRTKP
ncbi:MAG: hypothetical protein GY862_26605 [Gammaproteobacteria bacterium]|nr:hypothetical protein [Gammaproteobacteria bacterium]